MITLRHNGGAYNLTLTNELSTDRQDARIWRLDFNGWDGPDFIDKLTIPDDRDPEQFATDWLETRAVERFKAERRERDRLTILGRWKP